MLFSKPFDKPKDGRPLWGIPDPLRRRFLSGLCIGIAVGIPIGRLIDRLFA